MQNISNMLCLSYCCNCSIILRLIIMFGIITETTCLKLAHKVNGADVIIDKLTVGSNVTYRARDRFRHVSGDLVRTCREDQLWTGEQPVFEGDTLCTMVSKWKLLVIIEVSFKKSSYTLCIVIKMPFRNNIEYQ